MARLGSTRYLSRALFYILLFQATYSVVAAPGLLDELPTAPGSSSPDLTPDIRPMKDTDNHGRQQVAPELDPITHAAEDVPKEVPKPASNPLGLPSLGQAIDRGPLQQLPSLAPLEKEAENLVPDVVSLPTLPNLDSVAGLVTSTPQAAPQTAAVPTTTRVATSTSTSHTSSTSSSSTTTTLSSYTPHAGVGPALAPSSTSPHTSTTTATQTSINNGSFLPPKPAQTIAVVFVFILSFVGIAAAVFIMSNTKKVVPFLCCNKRKKGREAAADEEKPNDRASYTSSFDDDPTDKRPFPFMSSASTPRERIVPPIPIASPAPFSLHMHTPPWMRAPSPGSFTSRFSLSTLTMPSVTGANPFQNFRSTRVQSLPSPPRKVERRPTVIDIAHRELKSRFSDTSSVEKPANRFSVIPEESEFASDQSLLPYLSSASTLALPNPNPYRPSSIAYPKPDLVDVPAQERNIKDEAKQGPTEAAPTVNAITLPHQYTMTIIHAQRQRGHARSGTEPSVAVGSPNPGALSAQESLKKVLHRRSAAM